jgi:hypothetical protein
MLYNLRAVFKTLVDMAASSFMLTALYAPGLMPVLGAYAGGRGSDMRKKSDIGGVMGLLRVILVFGIVFGFLAGCSEKKEEAAKLEEEMMQLQTEADTGAAVATEDSLALPPAADASAIPEEEQPVADLMPPAPQGEGFTVQVASCEDPDYARYLVSLYADRGYEASVSTITYNSQTYYRVRIGNLESFSEAGVLKAELDDKYSIAAWIDRLDQ